MKRLNAFQSFCLRFLQVVEKSIGFHDHKTNIPFFAIVRPSFMEKAQLAFILASFKYPVVYINLSEFNLAQKGLLCIDSDSLGPGMDKMLLHRSEEFESIRFLYKTKIKSGCIY